MNFRIAIVEDDKTQRDYLRSLIEEWYQASKHTVQFSECQNAEEFSFKYMEKLCFDIIFLDIMMGTMNGMELATQIRLHDKNVQLVFLTGIKDYVFEGYKIGVMRYLIKPLKEMELKQLLNDCTALLVQKQSDFFSFSYMGESLRMSFSQIIMVQVSGHYLKMKTSSGEYQWKGSLTEMKGLFMGREFVMINRSTIINLIYVNKITREYCYLESGEQLMISRSEYARVNQAFVDFYM